MWRRDRKFFIQEKFLISIQTLCKFKAVGTDFCPYNLARPQSRSNLKYEEFQYQVNYSNYSINILSQPSFCLLLQKKQETQKIVGYCSYLTKV